MRRSLLFVVGLTAMLSLAPSVESQGKKKKSPLWSNQKDAFGDPLPFGAIARIGTVRYRLPEMNGLQSIALAPDGKHLAILKFDNIEILELPAWKRKRLIKGQSIDKDNPPQFVNLTYAPDGKSLATIDANTQTTYLIDPDTGKAIKKFKLGRNELGSLPTLSLLRDNQTLVASFQVNQPNGMIAQEVVVWDLAKGKLARSFRMPGDRTGGQTPRVISADGRWLAQPTFDDAAANKGERAEASIEIWDLAKGALARKIDTEFMMPHIAFSPDGKGLAATNGQNLLRLYDTNTGKEVHNIRMKNISVAHLEFAPDSASLYVADLQGKISVWDPVRGERTKTYDVANPSAVRNLIFQPDGKILALGFDMEAVHFWEVTSGKQFSPSGIPASIITEVAFAPNGELFVGSEDGNLAWWNPRTGARLRDLKLDFPFRNEDRGPFPFLPGDGLSLRLGRDRGISPLVTMPSNAEFFASTDGGILTFHDAKTGKVLYEGDLSGSNDRAVSFLDGGSKVASITNKKLRVWNTRTGRDVAAYDIPLQPRETPFRMVASSTGTHFAISSNSPEGQTRTIVWDAQTKKIVRQATGDGAGVARFSPDGHWLAMTQAQQIQLTRAGAARGETLLKPAEDMNEITQLVFSPDGRQLAAAGILLSADRESSRITIYEIASKKIRLELLGHAGGAAECLSYSPDSALLASGSMDTTVLVWQAGLRAHSPSPGKGEGEPDLATCYDQMAGANAKAAFQHMIKLAQTPKQTVKLFEDRIPPAKKPDAGEKTIPQWIQDLGSGNFGVRSKASAMLQKLGAPVEPELRAALPKAKDVETKRRIEELLERLALPDWSAEEVLHARAVEVLEAIGTSEARALLARWNKGEPGAVLTIESARALARLK